MATIQFSNGKTVEFNGQPTQQDVEEIAAKMGIQAPTQAAPAAPPTTFGQKVVGAAKAVGSFLTGAEQGLGGDIAAPITAPAQIQDASRAVTDKNSFINTLLTLKAKAVGAGQDTSHLDAILAHTDPGKYENPDIPSTGKVLADAGGTLFDALSAGTYGAARTGAMKTGELAAKGIPTAVRAAGAAGEAVAKGATTAKNAVPALTKTALLGKEGISTLAKIANPEAKAFVPAAQGGGGKAFSAVVDSTQKAIDSFVAKSKATLHAVKQAIPDVAIANPKITSTVNDAILKSVGHTAEYHGVPSTAAQLFKTPEELVHSGLLNEEEVGRVKGMVGVIKNWSDNSARGVLNLKEQLAPFYKDGLNGSNSILRNIQNGLKDLVTEVHPEIKPALDAASKNIDKADELTRHLMGTNPATGESKLITLAKNLNNPALKGYQHGLLQELQKLTGHNALSQLKGYADYLDLLAKDFPTKAGVIAKTAGKRIGLGAAGVAGGTEIKHLLGL